MFGNFISKVLKLVTMTKINMILELYFIFFFINYIILNQYLSRIFKLEKKIIRTIKIFLKDFINQINI